ncbi:MAG TPA: hypothetical protein VE999_13255 [Gemmataceae bacterium]|nr:hypothetical protein [Gemmataceae bacterium]
MKRILKHLGSNLALLFGVLCILTAAHQTTQPNGRPGDYILMAIVAFFGSIAYRSAKTRKLGEAKSPRLRLGIEFALMALMIAAWLLQNSLAERIATEPFVNFIVPMWAIAAYCSAFFGKRSSANSSA